MIYLRKIFLLISFIIGILSFNSLYYYDSHHERIEYSVFVNGLSQNYFPEKGDYTIDISCTESNAIWDYDSWNLKLTDYAGNTNKCYIDFTSIEKYVYLNEYIISKTGSIQGKNESEGKIVLENGYRYEGNNPYNYVKFNGELWRIIGVFETTLADGSTKQNLTKIIRNDSFGGFAFNELNRNYWELETGVRSSLNIILNDYYYTAIDGSDLEYCYYYSNTVKGDCDFTQIGMQNEYRNYVKNVTWHLGSSSSSGSASELYNIERSNQAYSGNATSSIGHIGLMYPSDYMYSVLESSCPRTTANSSYYVNDCSGNSWLFKYNHEWVLYNTSANNWAAGVIGWNGNLDLTNSGSSMAFNIRPAIYLDENTYIITGDGSYENPYIISLKK